MPPSSRSIDIIFFSDFSYSLANSTWRSWLNFFRLFILFYFFSFKKIELARCHRARAMCLS
jgi:hypothetical protein